MLFSHKKAITHLKYSLSLPVSLKLFSAASCERPLMCEEKWWNWNLFIYLFIYWYIYLILLDWKAVSRLCGRTATWQDLSHFTFFLPLAFSLSLWLSHTHTQRHTHIRAGKVHPPYMYWPDKSETPNEGDTDKHANLPSVCPFFRHSSSYFSAFCPLPSNPLRFTFSPSFCLLLSRSPTRQLCHFSLCLTSQSPSPPPILPDACDSHLKCLYLLLFLSFLPPSHSYLILTVSPSHSALLLSISRSLTPLLPSILLLPLFFLPPPVP